MKYGKVPAGSGAVATTAHNHSSASSATGKLHVSTPALSPSTSRTLLRFFVITLFYFFIF